MRPEDFGPGDVTISYKDIKCALCGRELKEKCPTPPPPPWQTWLKKNWFIPVGILALVALAIWWNMQPEICSEGKVQGDTCVASIKYEKVCDGKGGFKTGDKIGQCNSIPLPPEPCKEGTRSGTMCDEVTHIQYEKFCDGKGGFRRGKVLKRNSTDCGYPVKPPPVKYPDMPESGEGYGSVFIDTRDNNCKQRLFEDGKPNGSKILVDDPACQNAPRMTPR